MDAHMQKTSRGVSLAGRCWWPSWLFSPPTTSTATSKTASRGSTHQPELATGHTVATGKRKTDGGCHRVPCSDLSPEVNAWKGLSRRWRPRDVFFVLTPHSFVFHSRLSVHGLASCPHCPLFNHLNTLPGCGLRSAECDRYTSFII